MIRNFFPQCAFWRRRYRRFVSLDSTEYAEIRGPVASGRVLVGPGNRAFGFLGHMEGMGLSLLGFRHIPVLRERWYGKTILEKAYVWVVVNYKLRRRMGINCRRRRAETEA